ncbi:rhodanese-like domain-containing protein [Flavobacteriaceae bacterium 14752]|uniref:rhodanese-like domain-containing protein n=1 Tax=Mesohalobacter salilacus TaxID=2491711 RepID=UPI000F63C0FC|nr:rhodanese-like domain-containing protein [Flavobacteriaceae bacterium 14752]
MSILSEFLKSKTNIKTVSVTALKQLLNEQEKIQLLDVRTPAEFNQQHISKAVNIDVFKSDFVQKCQSKFEMSKPILLYCRSGQRSLNAAKKLDQIGFQDIYNLKGGMIAWSNFSSKSK